jgi:hypothetical protein
MATIEVFGDTEDSSLNSQSSQVADTYISEPLTEHYPCTVCGSTDRWLDVDVWRCKACWPTPLTAAARRTSGLKR